MEIRKEPRFLEVICKPIIYKFFKNFTNHRENANRVVVFGSRPLPNILKYKEILYVNTNFMRNRS